MMTSALEWITSVEHLKTIDFIHLVFTNQAVSSAVNIDVLGRHLSSCMEQKIDFQQKLEKLQARHSLTTQSLWKLEDKLEEYEGQEEREAELVEEIIGLKKQIVHLNRQVSRLRGKYFPFLIINSIIIILIFFFLLLPLHIR
jgi:hypothetical protein